MDLKQQAVSGARWTAFSTVTVTAIQFLQYAVLAHLLMPADFGVMAMLLLIISVSQIYADLGISEGIIYRQDTGPALLSSLYWLNLGASFVVTAVVIAASPAFAWIFDDARLGDLVWRIAPAMFIFALGRQSQVLLQKELRFKSLALIESVAMLAGLLTALAVALSRHTVMALIWGYLVTVSLRTLLSLAVVRSRPRLSFDAAGLGPYLEFGFWQVCEKTVNFFSERADQLLVGALLGAEQLGYYNLAYYLVVQPIYRINPVLTRVALPVFARVQDDPARLKSGYLQVLRLIAYVNFPMLAGACAVAGLLVPLVFGARWMPAVAIVQILAVVMLFRSVGNPVGSLLMALGRVKLAFQWTFFITAVQIPLLYFAAERFGALGVAWSLVAIQLVFLLPFYAGVIRPLLQATMSEYFGSFVPALAASAFMGSLVYLLESKLPGGPNISSLAVAVAAGVAIQGGLYLSLLRDQGREVLDSFRSR